MLVVGILFFEPAKLVLFLLKRKKIRACLYVLFKPSDAGFVEIGPLLSSHGPYSRKSRSSGLYPTNTFHL